MKIGVVFMAYGTPSSEEEIMPYFTDILGGKKPSDEMYEELVERYRLIDYSPLAKISVNQGKQAIEKLKPRFSEHTFIGVNGYRHIDPFVGDAIQQLIDQEVDQIIGFALTPQYAKHSTQLYHDAALEALKKAGSKIPYTGINEWHEQPGIIEYWGKELADVVQNLNERDYRVIYSAHNLPAEQTKGDVYQDQFQKMGELISEHAAVPAEKSQWAWQSGHEGGPIEWMRPFLEQKVEENLDNGIKHIISIPIGFISDNLEIFYDLDIELKEIIDKADGTLHRLPMPNTHPLLIEAITAAISEEVEKL
jgi:ferrochelatase